MVKDLNVLAISYAKRVLENGSREQIRMLAYAQVLDTYSIIIFTRKKDNLPVVYKEGNLTVYGTNASTRIGMLYRAYTLGKKILNKDSNKHWIVSSQDPFVTSIVGRALSRTPSGTHHVQVHGDPFSYDDNKSLIQKAWNIYGTYVLKQAKSIRVVSERAKRSLIKKIGITESLINVLSIQQDLTQLLSVAEHRIYNKEDPCTFIFVGRLSPEKNVQRIIKVFAMAYKEYNAVRLKIVGDGQCEKELKALTIKLGISDVVKFTPWTNNIASHMAQADVLVLASFHEGYGLVLVEAMASGLPVITTDVGCVGEILINDEHGVVISQADDDYYKDTIILLAQDSSLRKKYGIRGYQRIAEQEHCRLDYIKKWKDSFHRLY